MICTFAYIRAATLRDNPAVPGGKSSFLDSNKHGLRGLMWKFARIGERKSSWVAVSCVAMAIHILFIR